MFFIGMREFWTLGAKHKLQTKKNLLKKQVS